jgi:plastocyanin
MKARLTTPLLGLLVAGLVAAGCGGDDTEDAGDPGPAESPPAEAETNTQQESPGAGGGQTLQNPAEASGQLAFQKKTLKAKAGEVTLVMENPSPVPHAIAVRGGGADSSGDTVEEGGTSRVTVELKPGEYEFYCPVPGHEAGGMKGTLTVE